MKYQISFVGRPSGSLGRTRPLLIEVDVPDEDRSAVDDVVFNGRYKDLHDVPSVIRQVYEKHEHVHFTGAKSGVGLVASPSPYEVTQEQCQALRACREQLVGTDPVTADFLKSILAPSFRFTPVDSRQTGFWLAISGGLRQGDEGRRKLVGLIDDLIGPESK